MFPFSSKTFMMYHNNQLKQSLKTKEVNKQAMGTSSTLSKKHPFFKLLIAGRTLCHWHCFPILFLTSLQRTNWNASSFILYSVLIAWYKWWTGCAPAIPQCWRLLLKQALEIPISLWNVKSFSCGNIRSWPGYQPCYEQIGPQSTDRIHMTHVYYSAANGPHVVHKDQRCLSWDASALPAWPCLATCSPLRFPHHPEPLSSSSIELFPVLK